MKAVAVIIPLSLKYFLNPHQLIIVSTGKDFLFKLRLGENKVFFIVVWLVFFGLQEEKIFI